LPALLNERSKFAKEGRRLELLARGLDRPL